MSGFDWATAIGLLGSYFVVGFYWYLWGVYEGRYRERIAAHERRYQEAVRLMDEQTLQRTN